MFLNLLDERKKSLFLGLAYNLAQVDGNYSKEEELMIQSYCQEMQIEFNMRMAKDTASIVSDLCTICDSKEKRIIAFEIIGLAMIDGKYDLSEKELIENMVEKFGVDNEFTEKCEIEISRYMEVQKEINKLIME